MLTWSPSQQTAIDQVSEWLKQPGDRQVFRLFGAAGTGKSSIIRDLVSDANLVVQFAAFTGKAAKVMRDKGCRGASTIHSLIYTPRSKCAEKLTQLMKDRGQLLEDGGDTDAIDKLIEAEKEAHRSPA